MKVRAIVKCCKQISWDDFETQTRVGEFCELNPIESIKNWVDSVKKEPGMYAVDGQIVLQFEETKLT